MARPIAGSSFPWEGWLVAGRSGHPDNDSLPDQEDPAVVASHKRCQEEQKEVQEEVEEDPPFGE